MTTACTVGRNDGGREKRDEFVPHMQICAIYMKRKMEKKTEKQKKTYVFHKSTNKRSCGKKQTQYYHA